MRRRRRDCRNRRSLRNPQVRRGRDARGPGRSGVRDRARSRAPRARRGGRRSHGPTAGGRAAGRRRSHGPMLPRRTRRTDCSRELWVQNPAPELRTLVHILPVNARPSQARQRPRPELPGAVGRARYASRRLAGRRVVRVVGRMVGAFFFEGRSAGSAGGAARVGLVDVRTRWRRKRVQRSSPSTVPGTATHNSREQCPRGTSRRIRRPTGWGRGAGARARYRAWAARSPGLETPPLGPAHARGEGREQRAAPALAEVAGRGGGGARVTTAAAGRRGRGRARAGRGARARAGARPARRAASRASPSARA